MSSMLPPAQVIEEFRQRRKRQWIMAFPAFTSIFLVLIFADKPGRASLILTYTALALMLTYIVFSLINWRCPSCSRYLGKTLNPSFCAKCGARLKAE
ncbi:MAG TPA: hypothetical protein VF787_24745 [Thermoanaerobaculia bacterium]